MVVILVSLVDFMSMYLPQIHQIIFTKYVQLFTCQLFLNKMVLKILKLNELNIHLENQRAFMTAFKKSLFPHRSIPDCAKN